jgi:2-dehydropantoate 2-reductase
MSDVGDGRCLKVRAAVVYVATEMAGPGHVRHQGRGELLVEPGGDGDAWAEAFRGAGIAVDISTDARRALWIKLNPNCAYNALSAIGQLPYGRLVASDGVHEVMDEIVRECVAVACAEGVEVSVDIAASVRGLVGSMPEQRSATAQDLARGKRSEIDYPNGYVVQRRRVHGVPTPVNLPFSH